MNPILNEVHVVLFRLGFMHVDRLCPRYLIVDLLEALDLILYHFLDLLLVIINHKLIRPRLLLLLLVA